MDHDTNGTDDASERSGQCFPDDPPQWQGQLYPGLYPELLAEQAELFPGFNARKPRDKPRHPDLPGQAQLF